MHWHAANANGVMIKEAEQILCERRIPYDMRAAPALTEMRITLHAREYNMIGEQE